MADHEVYFNEVLPLDILVIIFSYLHGGVILRCGAVCKFWKVASDADALWIERMGRELMDSRKLTPSQNLKMNMEVAKKWREDHQMTPKELYLKGRRKENIPHTLRVFPKAATVKAFLRSSEKETKKITLKGGIPQIHIV
jgi:hypothetical protein